MKFKIVFAGDFRSYGLLCIGWMSNLGHKRKKFVENALWEKNSKFPKKFKDIFFTCEILKSPRLQPDINSPDISQANFCADIWTEGESKKSDFREIFHLISSPLVPTKKDRNDLFYFCTLNFLLHILRTFFLSTKSFHFWKLYTYITGKYLTKIYPHHHIVFNASLSGAGFFPSYNKALLVQKFYHLLVLQTWFYILLFSCSVRLFWGCEASRIGCTWYW